MKSVAETMNLDFHGDMDMKRSWKRCGKCVAMLLNRALLALGMFVAGACPAVAAEALSQRHITLIVASATGGPADAAARIIVGPMSAFSASRSSPRMCRAAAA